MYSCFSQTIVVPSIILHHRLRHLTYVRSGTFTPADTCQLTMGIPLLDCCQCPASGACTHIDEHVCSILLVAWRFHYEAEWVGMGSPLGSPTYCLELASQTCASSRAQASRGWIDILLEMHMVSSQTSVALLRQAGHTAGGSHGGTVRAVPFTLRSGLSPRIRQCVPYERIATCQVIM